MPLTLTYEPLLARVRIDATGLATAAEAVTIERSTDLITWTTVRGGVDVPVVAGAASLYDYEFVDRVPNHYRATVIRSTITFVGAGAAANAVNAAVTPPLPSGWEPGDLFVITSAIRNRGPGFPVASPAGYAMLLDTSNARLFGRTAQAGDTDPTVTFVGGTATSDTSARVFAFRGAGTTVLAAPATVGETHNAAAQNIAFPALSTPAGAGRRLVLHFAWKADDGAAAPLPGSAEAGEVSTTLGDDQMLVLDWKQADDDTDEPAGSFVITGGAAAISNGAIVMLGDVDGETLTADITPQLDTLWLKSVERPFLSRPVVWRTVPDITIGTRNALFAVEGRTDPVAVTQAAGPFSYPLEVITVSEDEQRDLELLLLSGDVLYVHAPASCAGGPRTMYAVVSGDVPIRPAPTGARSGPVLAHRIFTVPLTRCVPPGPDVFGSTATWQTVLTAYATWADVLAAHPTWADVLDLIADPEEVIVP